MNTQKQTLRIIVAVDLLLLLFSAFASHVELPFVPLVLKFKPFEKIFNFERQADNASADSLISSYIERESGAGGEMNLNNAKTFINPVVGSGFALDNFFRAMVSESDNKTIRIAHYGDSQTEGDRITSLLRNKLQAQFGGSGYGFIPLADVAIPVSYERSSSENVIKYNVFSKRLPQNEFYGLSGCAFKFTDQIVEQSSVPDSLESGDTTQTAETPVTPENTIRHFKGADISFKFSSGRTFSKAFLLFGKVHGNLFISITGQNGAVVYSGNLFDTESYRNNQLNKLDIPVSDIATRLSIHIEGDKSAVFYGLFLDGDNKLQVDNYGIRGHSGDGLLKLDDAFTTLQLQYLDTRLVIFQYGGNSVPYILNMQRKDYIEKIYLSLFSKFRKLLPNASILVVGVGDMAKSYDGEYRSYPGLPMVRDALRDAALKSNCAFWDLFETMGGANSILKWADKGLAARDGHFSLSGERIVANELASHILREFAAYKKRNNIP